MDYLQKALDIFDTLDLEDADKMTVLLSLATAGRGERQTVALERCAAALEKLAGCANEQGQIMISAEMYEFAVGE